MILMLDNYDSFTYNLVHYLGELGEDVEVYRNDKISEVLPCSSFFAFTIFAPNACAMD